MIDVFKCDLTDVHFAVYYSHTHGLNTSAIMFKRGLDPEAEKAEVFRQLRDEITAMDCVTEDEDLRIVRQVDRYDLHVRGRFTPIGEIKVLAVMDPGKGGGQ